MGRFFDGLGDEDPLGGASLAVLIGTDGRAPAGGVDAEAVDHHAGGAEIVARALPVGEEMEDDGLGGHGELAEAVSALAARGLLDVVAGADVADGVAGSAGADLPDVALVGVGGVEQVVGLVEILVAVHCVVVNAVEAFVNCDFRLRQKGCGEKEEEKEEPPSYHPKRGRCDRFHDGFWMLRIISVPIYGFHRKRGVWKRTFFAFYGKYCCPGKKKVIFRIACKYRRYGRLSRGGAYFSPEGA